MRRDEAAEMDRWSIYELWFFGSVEEEGRGGGVCAGL